MKTYTGLTNFFTNLTQNTSTQNVSLGQQLINDQHRYLIQKYFDNERSYTTVTIGAQDLTLTSPPSKGDIAATLTASWTSITCQQLVVFSDSDQRTVIFTQGSTNIFWQTGLLANCTTAISTIGVQAYPIPANVSKIKNDTITVGQLVYTPAPVQSIQEWTILNALPYTSDIPNYFYIYNNQVLFWPIPSTSGNVVTFNYKGRVSDMSYADFNQGTIGGSAGDNTIIGSGTSWHTTGGFPVNTDLSFANLMLNVTPPAGDGLWYPIQRFTSDTGLILNLPIVNGPNMASGATYTIGQVPLLQEDFQDTIVYGALKIYFSSIVENPDAYKGFSSEYDRRLDLLESYAGTKSINVDLGTQPVPANPNLFLFANPNGN